MALAAAFLAITVAAGADEPLGTEAAAPVLQQHMLPRGEPLVPADENHQCFNSTNPHFSCDAAPCFCNATWDDHEVQSIDGLLFSAKYNLSLHMFKPPSTDVRLKRPAMVMIHGGGFINGNRDDKKDLIEWCMELAMRGYVAVSIDYRINKTMMQTDSETSMVWAAHDAKAAASPGRPSPLKVGSLQAYVKHDATAEDVSSSIFFLRCCPHGSRGARWRR